MKEKLLLITFPVDLGNKTLAKRFVKLFENAVDLQVHDFIPNQKTPGSVLEYSLTVANRLVGSVELQNKVRSAYQEGRKVLFHGVSPALFAYPVMNPEQSYIFTDWTRKLYEPIYGVTMSPPWLTFIHKKVLNSQKYVIGLTDAVVEEIAADYQVPHHKLKKGRLPFSIDLDLFLPSPNRHDDTIRILFVGGDFQRKGGDVLLDWFLKNHNPHLQLTLLTSQDLGDLENVTTPANIQYGEPQHIELFKNHDVFVLPTKCEGYPSVIGEAACAGLAVLTTKQALGAPEIIQDGVNGYICDSQQELLDRLNQLVQNKSMVESMKQKSRQIMENKFATNLVLDDFMNCIFED
jgi:glycosyltransferase involved in cell wall biosynthesis